MKSSAIRDQIPININVPSKDNNNNIKYDENTKYNIQINNAIQKNTLRPDNRPNNSYLDNQT